MDALFIFLVIVVGVDDRRRSSLRSWCLPSSTGAVRACRRSRSKARTALEVTWSVIPLFIFFVIFMWGAMIYFKERTPPRGATEVYVVAKQWMWKLQHEEGQREINELHVPVGRDVKLIMTSQDVIHSFYVPAFRIKQDVLPGRYTTALVSCHQGRDLSPVLRRILRHAALRHDWASCRDGTGTVPGLAERRRRDRALWPRTARRCSSNSAAPPATAPIRKAVGPNLAGLVRQAGALEDGRTVTADENYIRESILIPAPKLSADSSRSCRCFRDW